MFTKRIVFITACKADVYWGDNSHLKGPLELHAGPAGIEELSRHLRAMPETLTYVIVDVVEEEFKNETIPHLFGRDKKEYINRRLNQYYRTTTYRGTLNLGRKKTGRRDDKILFTALTNPGVFKPWIDCLLEHKVPIVGVYTPSVLAGRILQKLDIKQENVLLITQQKNSGIRQTFFHNKRLKLSRLAPIAELDEQQYADYIFSEIEKTRRYLSRLQLLNFNHTLDVCLISDKAVVSAIVSGTTKNNQDTGLSRLHVYSVEDIETEFGFLKEQRPYPAKNLRYCDQLFSQILLSRLPSLNYTEATNKKYKTFRDVRIGMYAASALFLFAAFIWSSKNVIEGRLLAAYSGKGLASTEFIQQEYQKIMANIPDTPIEAAGLKESVDIAKSLTDHKTIPEKLMQAISVGLNTNTVLQIENIQWIVSNDPYAAVNPKNQSKLLKLARSSKNRLLSKNNDKIYQIALIKGYLRHFSGEYRKAFDLVNKLASALQQHVDIVDVQIIKHPLDVDSTLNLTGKTGVNVKADKASFVLRAVLNTGLTAH